MPEKKKPGEEEQAALCLMALSCGSVFAWNMKREETEWGWSWTRRLFASHVFLISGNFKRRIIPWKKGNNLGGIDFPGNKEFESNKILIFFLI